MHRSVTYKGTAHITKAIGRHVTLALHPTRTQQTLQSGKLAGDFFRFRIRHAGFFFPTFFLENTIVKRRIVKISVKGAHMLLRLF
jgi:hypothetical protein